MAVAMAGTLLAAGVTGPVPARAHGTAGQPDFSGVWLAFAAEPAGRLGPAWPDLAAEGERIVAAFEARHGPDAPEPGSYCVPAGMPSVMTSLAGYPIEIVQAPDQITMLAELEMQVRRVYMDGRGHPDDYPRTRIGHSVGHWDGDALAVDTRLFKEWPLRPSPRSERAHMTERIHLTTRDRIDVENTPFIVQDPLSDAVLVNELTIDDPVMFDEPVEITIYYQPVPDTMILEYDCPVDLWRQALERAAGDGQ